MELTLLIVRVLCGTFFTGCLIASLCVFRVPNAKGVREFHPITTIPMLDILWALLAPIFHWRKSAAGRRCVYGMLLAALLFAGTFLVG